MHDDHVIFDHPDVIAAGASHVAPVFGVLALVLCFAVVVALLFHRFRQSLLTGYFLVGLVIANSGVLAASGYNDAGPIIDSLAEIGVVLLMFTLGIEFSFNEIRRLKRVALLGGAVQVASVNLLAMGVALLMGYPLIPSALIGFMIALSSTALGLKIFQDSGQLNTKGAKLTIGIAIYQDILVVVVIVMLPALLSGGDGGAREALSIELLWAAIKAVVFLGFGWVMTMFVVPPALKLVSAVRSRELFTLTVVALCVGVATVGYLMDLSLAMGAFVAGLVVSGSVYSHRILADVLPFKDLFLTLFFVSVGMMIDVEMLLENWYVYVGWGLVILLVKFLVVVGVGRILGFPIRPTVQAAIGLSSIGEFSLVLVNQILNLGGLGASEQQFFLVTTALTMASVPIWMRFWPGIARWMEARDLFGDSSRAKVHEHGHTLDEIKDHVIICGYGPVGRQLDEALERVGVPRLIIELNAETVMDLKKLGRLALFADVAQPDTLALAGIDRARMLVLTFPAIEVSRVAVHRARELNPHIAILCRARFASDVAMLRSMGEEGIVHDETESAMRVVRRSLRELGVSEDIVMDEGRLIRYRTGTED
ncbi:cation:proton antiporter [Sulfuriroseicoccus oceanibius]|uniref:Cation:proton antiporter n=1 Tax=Sulfuriroseicoccus oceanibius TaxID=2707525 RepID=A0A6B3L660_9BACT|nr:cation:proton antiporter [Sulfuriroseicoccus oceanibius]QQL44695.1 cation:proton antiporter [Sulfuriroseicoccus oceanibius]